MSLIKGFSGRLRVATRLKSFLVATALVLSLGAGYGHLAVAQASTGVPAEVATSGSGPATTSYAEIVKRAAPAVVTIRSENRVQTTGQFPFDDERLREYFGQPGRRQPPTERRASGVGSGVIVSPDGYVLTNYHVIEDAEQIKVDLTDNRTFEATVVGSDKPSDLALLKVSASNLPTLRLGNSDNVQVGDTALAIGNPMGIGQTVTMGIISAKGRQTGASDGSFEDFLQTDAPINQGNSGGALVDMNGELIGINSQILSRTGGSIGIGFAIPSNMAKNVLEQLVKSGTVHRGQLGVVVQKVTTDMAASLGMNDARGVIVSRVQQGSAAERAGIRQGDVITSLNGVSVNDPNTFRNQVAGTQPGSLMPLTLLRGERELQIQAALGELKVEKVKADIQNESAPGRTVNDPSKLGIGVEPLTADAARRLELPAGTQGLVITQVDPSGAAAAAGLERGDVIVQVNQQPVRSVAELKAAVERRGTRPALLLMNRQGASIYLTVKTAS
jgi:serine protease Do